MLDQQCCRPTAAPSRSLPRTRRGGASSSGAWTQRPRRRSTELTGRPIPSGLRTDRGWVSSQMETEKGPGSGGAVVTLSDAGVWRGGRLESGRHDRLCAHPAGAAQAHPGLGGQPRACHGARAGAKRTDTSLAVLSARRAPLSVPLGRRASGWALVHSSGIFSIQPSHYLSGRPDSTLCTMKGTFSSSTTAR